MSLSGWPTTDHFSYPDHDIFAFEFAWDNCLTDV